MWIKDVRNCEVEINENGNVIYTGNVDNVEEDIKNKEAKSMRIENKKIIIEL